MRSLVKRKDIHPITRFPKKYNLLAHEKVRQVLARLNFSAQWMFFDKDLTDVDIVRKPTLEGLREMKERGFDCVVCGFHTPHECFRCFNIGDALWVSHIMVLHSRACLEGRSDIFKMNALLDLIMDGSDTAQDYKDAISDSPELALADADLEKSRAIDRHNLYCSIKDYNKYEYLFRKVLRKINRGKRVFSLDSVIKSMEPSIVE